MPPIFKALTTTMAWILWIISLVIGFGACVSGLVNGDLRSTDPLPVVYYIAWAVALGYAIGAVGIMILRKKMEK
jgi:ABC-type sugar transport system permease subunit